MVDSIRLKKEPAVGAPPGKLGVTPILVSTPLRATATLSTFM